MPENVYIFENETKLFARIFSNYAQNKTIISLI